MHAALAIFDVTSSGIESVGIFATIEGINAVSALFLTFTIYMNDTFKRPVMR